MFDWLREEGVNIIEEYELDPIVPDDGDVKKLWDDFYTEADDSEITHLQVSRARDKLRYDFRVLDWLWEWYGFWSEEMDLYNRKPSIEDYILFFTIKGEPDIDTKNTSFYECTKYLRKLERAKERAKK